MANSVYVFTSPVTRKVRGTDVQLGQELYCIQDDETGLYWIWAYTTKEYAERIAKRVSIENEEDRAANWRGRLIQLCASGRTED